MLKWNKDVNRRTSAWTNKLTTIRANLATTLIYYSNSYVIQQYPLALALRKPANNSKNKKQNLSILEEDVEHTDYQTLDLH